MIGGLTRRITTGDLMAGQRLPSHAELCDQYGVSTTVVRQAMQWLKAAGLVEGVHGVGVGVGVRKRRDT